MLAWLKDVGFLCSYSVSLHLTLSVVFYCVLFYAPSGLQRSSPSRSDTHLYFNKQNLTEDQKSKAATLVSLTDQATVTHTFSPSSHTSLSYKLAVVMRTLNPSPREDYKTGGNSSQSPSSQLNYVQEQTRKY